ncbi:hypothetical protein BVY02_02575 [bacterium J17]|nr:hypothetical protein BVY02_02575 [bacterium J17]
MIGAFGSGVKNFLLKCILLLFSSVALIFFLIRSIWDPKWRESLPERLGFAGWSNVDGAVIWVHAASVGEVVGALPLLAELRAQRPESKILLTTTSVTGRAEAKRRAKADYVLLAPLDHLLVLFRVLGCVRPQILVLVETEIWPSQLLIFSAKAIPIVLVNGRISDSSFPSYSRLGIFFRPLLSRISFFLVQSTLDAERFISLGAQETRVQVNGSTKYDAGGLSVSEEDKKALRSELGLASDAPVFVAGSVRPKEDEIVVDAYRAARGTVPNLQLVIAPRHPERFDEVAKILDKAGLQYGRRSKGEPVSERVLLLDTLGELGKVYSLCDFSFVGGSLVNIGGHNPLEPASFSKAVIVGPYTHNVRDAVASLKREGGMIEVETCSELTQALLRLTEDVAFRDSVAEAAYRVWQSNNGATKKTLQVLSRYLPEPSSGVLLKKVHNL